MLHHNEACSPFQAIHKSTALPPIAVEVPWGCLRTAHIQLSESCFPCELNYHVLVTRVWQSATRINMRECRYRILSASATGRRGNDVAEGQFVLPRNPCRPSNHAELGEHKNIQGRVQKHLRDSEHPSAHPRVCGFQNAPLPALNRVHISSAPSKTRSAMKTDTAWWSLLLSLLIAQVPEGSTVPSHGPLWSSTSLSNLAQITKKHCN